MHSRNKGHANTYAYFCLHFLKGLQYVNLILWGTCEYMIFYPQLSQLFYLFINILCVVLLRLGLMLSGVVRI